MIGYALVGSNDLERSKAFFDAVTAPLGGKRGMASDRMQLWAGGGGAMFGVCTPYDGAAPQPGNGTMLALAAGSREAVDSAHAVALKSGGKDEGAPGDRGGGFYGAYFRDPDGNKFCVFKMG